MCKSFEVSMVHCAMIFPLQHEQLHELHEGSTETEAGGAPMARQENGGFCRQNRKDGANRSKCKSWANHSQSVAPMKMGVASDLIQRSGPVFIRRWHEPWTWESLCICEISEEQSQADDNSWERVSASVHLNQSLNKSFSEHLVTIMRRKIMANRKIITSKQEWKAEKLCDGYSSLPTSKWTF